MTIIKVRKMLKENGLNEAIKVLDTETLKVKVGDIDGSKWHKITIDDVVEYYVSQASDILSGIRTLGDIAGDWRCIDNIAHTCLEVFKLLNITELRKRSEARGLTPKF